MKKIISSLCLFFLCAFVQAQNGLDNIYVETYYISDAADYDWSIANGNMDTLPVNSVTYRVYVDMSSPGYSFQSAYGSPTHQLQMNTTTSFFNNTDRGSTTPTYSKNQAKGNTVMLDSWISVGAGCVGNYGVPKSVDNGVGTVVNSDGILQNNNGAAGIPLTDQDGLLAGTPVGVTTVGIDADLAVFDGNRVGNMFSTTNGAWAALGGARGPDTMTNMVLIAQVTTDGVFCFDLNVQLGDSTGGTQQFVATSATDPEIHRDYLHYCSNTVAVNNLHASTSSFTVYPNPTADLVTMEIVTPKASKNNSYVIYDQKGSIVFSKKLGEIPERYLETVDMSCYAAGAYIVELSVDGIASAKKIIKN